MELTHLLLTLACPLLMVALLGWWAWAARRSRKVSQKAPDQSAVEKGEISRMRAQIAQLDQPHARGSEEGAAPETPRNPPGTQPDRRTTDGNDANASDAYDHHGAWR